MIEDKDINEALSNKDYMEFPEALNKVCTNDEFHKMMTSHNSDIPIEEVNFLDYPDIN